MRKLLFPAVCLLVSGVVTAGPAVADPGVVSGVVTANATGQPVAGACVTLFDLDLNEVTSGCAGADGSYQIAGVEPGYYKAKATADGYAELWSYRGGSVLDADVVSLPSTLNFALRQGSGTLRGQVTDGGVPAVGARVRITDVNQRWWSSADTADDGTYAFTGLTPDTYKVLVTFGDRSQWAPQRGEFYGAGGYLVANDQVTVVDEEILPYASLRLVAVDEVTGAPVGDACSQLSIGGSERHVCAGPDGVMSYGNVPPLAYLYDVTVWSSGGTHWHASALPVSLFPGEVTEKWVPMRPAAAIVTTVRDRSTRAPVANICVETHTVPVVGVVDRDYTNFCSDESGNLLIGPVDAGTYQLLVKPLDERYGMQWVGLTGGTGDLREARTVAGQLRTQVSIPPIEMDLAGTVRGTVTDRATGAPVGGVCVYPYAVNPALGFAFEANCSKGDGTYTISGLGPYWWPLEFAESRGRYAWQWSGGAPDRFAARRVRVWPNGNTTHNTSLVPGGVITGRTFDQQGTPAFGYIYTYNARTGDIVDMTTTLPDETRRYTINSLATQDVKIQYYVDANCWHRDATDFASATPIPVVAGQTIGGVDLGPCRLSGGP